MKMLHVVSATVLIAVGSVALHAAQQPPVKRTELVRQDLDAGREVIQVRVDFPQGVAFPPHSHPGVEIAYVIEGALEYRVDGNAPVILKAGQSLFIPAGAIHTARNVGQDNAAELATYIVDKTKPLVALAKSVQAD